MKTFENAINDLDSSLTMILNQAKFFKEQVEFRDSIINDMKPFFERMGKPRFDVNETDSYICDSTDFKCAVNAFVRFRDRKYL
jgi:hypothetical protein